MECIEDIRGLIEGVLLAQSKGVYTLENSAQIAPIVRRLLNTFPQIQGKTNVKQQPIESKKPIQTNTDNLIKKIKAEPSKVNESLMSNVIETKRVKSSIEINEPGIETISLPIE